MEDDNYAASAHRKRIVRAPARAGGLGPGCCGHGPPLRPEIERAEAAMV